MTKVIKILSLVLISFVTLLSQPKQEYWNIGYPSHIPLSSSFEISLVTSKVFGDAESLEIYFAVDNGTDIKSSELKTGSLRKKINVTQSEYPGVYETVFKLVIDLKDTLITRGEYFQILTTFKCEGNSKLKIKAAGVFKKDDIVIAFCKSDNDEIYQQPEEPYFNEIELNFYKPQKYAGRSLQLNSGSYLDVYIPASEVNSLTIDFWMKLNNFDISALSLEYKNSRNKIIELKYNFYSMLFVENGYSQSEFSKPTYVNKKFWNHIILSIDRTNKRMNIFCNGELIAACSIINVDSKEDLVLRFTNNEENKSFNIEQLQVFESNIILNVNAPNVISDKHHTDNIKRIFSATFDNTEEFTSLLQKKNIEFGGIQLVKSDAPIFTPSPELNIEVYQNSYELSWQPGGKNSASVYILEKSLSDRNFSELIRIQSTDEYEKTYSYTDAIDDKAGVVYYRIKQLNKDGSVVYSGIVKVGQGKLNEPITVEQNFPNPFNPKTSIVVDLHESCEVEIIIYSLEGREIITLYQGVLEKGHHQFEFDGSELPSGIYLYKVQTPAFTQTRKMILMK